MDPVIAVGLGAVLVGMVAVVAFRLSHRSQARQEQRATAPWTRSEKLSLAGIAVGAAIGVAGFVLSAGDGSNSTDEGPGTNPIALAALIRQGPFTEQLPDPLKPAGLVDVRIGDPSAASRVDALELEARYPKDALSSFVRSPGGLPVGGRGFQPGAGEDP